MRFITTFGDAGYDLYGEKFLKTFIRHWDAPLTVYYEEKRSFPKCKRINYKLLWDVPNVREYVNSQRVRETERTSDYRFQVSKFCRKSFVQIDEIKKGGKVFWLDADIETNEKADLAKVKRTLKDAAIAYMGREGFYPCTSFVGFDGDHELIDDFITEYEDVYLSGRIFDLPEWHDAFVFNYIRDYCEKRYGLPCNDVGKGIKGNQGSFNVCNSVLPWVRHKKGNRKYKDCKKW